MLPFSTFSVLNPTCAPAKTGGYRQYVILMMQFNIIFNVSIGISSSLFEYMDWWI